MCGIVGFQGDFDQDLLGRMSAAVAHRGPDDAGTFLEPEDGIGLASTRLSIIDLSPAGHMPMSDAAGAVTITYNGELYNYRELRDELEAEGFTFRGSSDTEVLLALYLRGGITMLDRLNGMFAFAIWDSRERVLFLARDGAGVKPLYYAATARGFLFASEVKALLQDPSLPRDIDPLAVQHHLAYVYCPAPRTMLKAVHKLEPGNALLVRDGRVQKKWQYYDLPYDTPSQSISEREAVSRVRDTLALAVQRQMVADVPVGAFLSGGIDSSSVVALASRHRGGEKLQCFTIGFRDHAMQNEGFADDLPYAKRTAAALGVDLHTVVVGPEMAQLFPQMVYQLDEPLADPAAVNVFLICQLARQKGIKVLLSGVGGDDLFAGYRRHQAIQAERYWSWLPRSARIGLARTAGAISPRTPALRRVGKAFRYADLSGDARLASYFLWTPPRLESGLLSEEIREELRGVSSTAPFVKALSSLPEDMEPLQKMLYLEGKYYLPDHNLNYADKMSMACGVEVRVPFTDSNLVALAASLPPRFKQRGQVGKWILRESMKPLLPHEVLTRPKTGFGVPVRQWLANDLRPLVDDLLDSACISRRGLFDTDSVARLLELDRRGRVDAAYPLFSMMTTELWCRQFIDSSLPQPVA